MPVKSLLLVLHYRNISIHYHLLGYKFILGDLNYKVVYFFLLYKNSGISSVYVLKFFVPGWHVFLSFLNYHFFPAYYLLWLFSCKLFVEILCQSYHHMMGPCFFLFFSSLPVSLIPELLFHSNIYSLLQLYFLQSVLLFIAHS